MSNDTSAPTAILARDLRVGDILALGGEVLALGGHVVNGPHGRFVSWTTTDGLSDDAPEGSTVYVVARAAHQGRCWDGRDAQASAGDACTARATTVLPAAVWAPAHTAEYPALVPCCQHHRDEIERADDAAAARAEDRATAGDALS